MKFSATIQRNFSLKTSLFFGLLAFLNAQNSSTPLFLTNVQYIATVNNEINLFWNYNSTHITFEIQAISNVSTGVVFGFQNPLAPTTFDVLLAWIDKTGAESFKNVKITQSGSKFTYTINAKQNWLPLNATYKNGYQVFHAIRQIKLPSCDIQSIDNIDIGLGKINVVYSIGNPVDLMAQTATIQKLNLISGQILDPSASISCYQVSPTSTFSSTLMPVTPKPAKLTWIQKICQIIKNLFNF